MSSSGHDRYPYGNLSKSRRSSPGEHQHHSSVFSTGQGGRTVLPPLSSAFPTSRFPVLGHSSNQYTQPRSSPGRYELSQALYNQWPGSTPPPTSPYYETHERYPHQSQLQYTYQDSRKLPPLSTNPWQTTTPYLATPSNYTGTGGTRSSPPVFDYDYPTSSQGPAYTYHVPTQEYDDHPHVPSMNPQGHMAGYDGLESRNNPQRSSSPYNKSSHVSHAGYVIHQPITPTSPEEPAAKKKRKRADPGQLKVLNETYNRTAFPSTEERVELAKALDMSARSVQIWFQNKRQAMRQTNRQSSTTGASAHPYNIAGPDHGVDDLVEHASMAYGGSIPAPEMSYTSKHSPDASRSHISQASSSHRRRGHEEPADHRKWPRSGGYN